MASVPQTPEVALASHFFDGTYNALERFVVEGAPLDESGSSPSSSSSLQRIPVEPAAGLDYERFELEYMARNVPVLVTGLTDGWKANAEWVQERHRSPPVRGHRSEQIFIGGGSGDDSGAPSPTEEVAAVSNSFEPNVELMASRFGDSMVEVESPSSISSSVDGDDVDSPTPTSSLASGYERPRQRIRLREFDIADGTYIKVRLLPDVFQLCSSMMHHPTSFVVFDTQSVCVPPVTVLLSPSIVRSICCSLTRFFFFYF